MTTEDQTALTTFDPRRYWEQRLSTRYTLGSTGWLSLGERFNSWSYAVRRLVFTRLACDALNGKRSAHVLDVGSGTGFYLNLWQQLGVEQIVGSDLTSAAVERLRVRFPRATIQRIDIGTTELPLGPRQYDAISVMDVMFHIVDDDRYVQSLQNLAGLLKPDGRLIFSEIFVPQEYRSEHQVSRTKVQIESMLSAAGLTVACTRPVFFLMNTPVASQSRLLHRWWDLVCRLAKRHEALGWCVGAAAFPMEVTLGRLLREGPSTHMIVCRPL